MFIIKPCNCYRDVCGRSAAWREFRCSGRFVARSPDGDQKLGRLVFKVRASSLLSCDRLSRVAFRRSHFLFEMLGATYLAVRLCEAVRSLSTRRRWVRAETFEVARREGPAYWYYTIFPHLSRQALYDSSVSLWFHSKTFLI